MPDTAPPSGARAATDPTPPCRKCDAARPWIALADYAGVPGTMPDLWWWRDGVSPHHDYARIGADGRINGKDSGWAHQFPYVKDMEPIPRGPTL